MRRPQCVKTSRAVRAPQARTVVQRSLTAARASTKRSTPLVGNGAVAKFSTPKSNLGLSRPGADYRTYAWGCETTLATCNASFSFSRRPAIGFVECSISDILLLVLSSYLKIGT
jgi:hypothetical protein